jgi:hypothetical protein
MVSAITSATSRMAPILSAEFTGDDAEADAITAAGRGAVRSPVRPGFGFFFVAASFSRVVAGRGLD